MAIRAKIHAGVCGFTTIVEASSPDGVNVTTQMESDCPRVQAMAQAMAAEWASLDALQEVLRKPLIETTPVRLSVQCRLHSTCPVPVGLLKAIEAAASLALPADCGIELTRVESGHNPPGGDNPSGG